VRSQQKTEGLLLKQAQMLIPRLERLTPDSSWAHRASGCRGSLLRLSQRVEAHGMLGQRLKPEEAHDLAALEQALNLGFFILREAARERYR
jgi:hypothetical protein